ncbi:pentapeptide repeat-containing protein [Adonisia turfae]|uniref:pentapeptide repeat-containing protein n=1 Tax=Adonisia turfae TaxID=2950184 RepID=UPI0013D0AA76
MTEPRKKLSPKDRLRLIQTLNALPSAQFSELIFALNAPQGNIPGNQAAQSARSAELLSWVESALGPGLLELETVLAEVISSQHLPTNQQFLKFIIKGKVSGATPVQVGEIVELLRKKTGDDSIEITFFKDGSISMILAGSLEGFTKLQELFESDELQDLELPPVEAIYYIANNTTDARKAWLVQALRLENKSFSIAITIARELDRARHRARTRALAYTRNSNDLATIFKLALQQAQAQDLDMSLDLALERARNSAVNLVLERNHSQNLYRDLTIALERAHNLATALESARNSEVALVIVRSLARDLESNLRLVQNLTRDLERDFRDADLSNANLRNINLRQTNLENVSFKRADLAGANLTGANLTGANFNEANVIETIFGENLGLTERKKLDLQRRGAILLDPPSSDVPSMAVV